MSRMVFLRSLAILCAFAIAIAAGVSVLSNEKPSAAASGLDAYDSENSTPEGFVVRERKYTFEGSDLILLEVENQTEVNYRVTVTGTYLDKDGEPFRWDSRTFEGFSAGWRNSFFFQADFAYDDFVYTLEAEVYEGECVASQLALTWNLSRGYAMRPEDGARWNQAVRHGTAGDNAVRTVPAIFLDLQYENQAGLDISFAGEYLVVDARGEAFAMSRFACEADQWTKGNCGYNPIYWSLDATDASDTWGYPEELRGDVTVYLSLTTITGDFVPQITDEAELLRKRNFSVPGWIDSTFSVSGKRFTDANGKNDMVVLDVTNQSKRNMLLTINASYLTKMGTLLKKETKTFAGFAGGWTNSFLFEPGIDFYEFTYTLEFEEYAGTGAVSQTECAWEFAVAASYAPGVLNHLEEYWKSGKQPPVQYTLCLDLMQKNSGELDLWLRGEILIVGADGRLFYHGKESEYLLLSGQETCNPQVICTLPDGEALPEALEGENVRVVFAVTGASIILKPTAV